MPVEELHHVVRTDAVNDDWGVHDPSERPQFLGDDQFDLLEGRPRDGVREGEERPDGADAERADEGAPRPARARIGESEDADDRPDDQQERQPAVGIRPRRWLSSDAAAAVQNSHHPY